MLVRKKDFSKNAIDIWKLESCLGWLQRQDGSTKRILNETYVFLVVSKASTAAQKNIDMICKIIDEALYKIFLWLLQGGGLRMNSARMAA